MDATKKLLKNIPEYLLYFLATDLICMLLSWIANIILRPIFVELARGDADRLAMVDKGFWIVFAILFYGILAVILAKSSIQRGAYLTATVGREYHFAHDLRMFAGHGLPVGVAAYLIFCLPVTVLVALFPDILYIPTIFYPQYALLSLVGPWVGLALDVGIYAVFSLILFPCLHYYWEKNRLHK